MPVYNVVIYIARLIENRPNSGLSKDTASLQAVEDLVEMLPIHLIDYIFDYLDSRYSRLVAVSRI